MFKLNSFLFVLISLCTILNGYELNKNVTVPTNNLNDSTLVTPRPLMIPPISTQVETQETSTDGQTEETSDAQENTYLTTTSTTEQPPDVYEVFANRTKPFINNSDHQMVYDDYEWQSFDDFVEVPIPEKLQQRLAELNNESAQLKQLPTNPLTMLVQNTPCSCTSGICSCCTGMILSTFNSRACMKMKYIPEEFAFDFRVLMNNYELFNRRVSGRNPAPICISPARIPFIDVCAKFSDIYFIGRNMHICLEVGASFEGYDLFNRNFDCMRIGQQGIKVVKPEEGGGIPQQSPGNNGVDADVDAGDDNEEYDEILS